MPTTIALDAMGADRAPKPEVDGAILAARHYDVEVLLVGNEDLIRKELRLHPLWQRLPIEIVHASEVIGMHEKAAQAVRSKRDSSMRVGLRLVRDGRAAGFVSAGNTGACMATAKMVLGTLPGVDRPALAAVFPDRAGHRDHPHRRGRERRFQAAKSAAVRHHGRRVFPHDFCRTAFPPPSIRAWACFPSAKKNPRATS